MKIININIDRNIISIIECYKNNISLRYISTVFTYDLGIITDIDLTLAFDEIYEHISG